MATQINSAALSDLLSKKSVFLVDVREPSEFRREHIAEAHLYPLSSFNPETVLKASGPNATICVTCASGGRSSQACQTLSTFLAKNGSQYGNIKLKELTGGMSSWRMAKGPVVEDANAPLPIIRQVHIIASLLIIGGSLLTRFCHPNFFMMPLFVGCGLFLSGATGFCGMALILQRLPYNRSQVCSANN